MPTSASSSRVAGELLEFLLGDRVGVLVLLWEAAGAHLLRVLAEAIEGDLADVRVALHELRLVPCVDPEQVVEDEHLTVGRRPAPIPITGISSFGSAPR